MRQFSTPWFVCRRVRGSDGGDKTPGYVTQILRIHQIYPKAKFIHMIRDARDACLSLYRTAWKGKETRQIAQYWNDCVSDGVRQGAQLPAGAYMEVHYEDLVLDTRGSLQKVCDFLDEPFEENMLEFHLDVSDKIAPWEQEFHTKTMRAPKSSDVGRWRKEMTTLQLATLEYVAGKTMEQTGQNRFYNGAGSLIPLGVGLGYWAADVSLPIRRALGIHFPHLRRKL